MVQPASEQRPGTTSDGNAALLAADIGGTHARAALVNLPHNRNQRITVLHYRQYICADYPDLASIPRNFIVERFLNKRRMHAYLERVPIRLMEHGRFGVIGAAGWHLDNAVERQSIYGDDN